ncbi:MAG TPA: hypothetical protein IAB38_00105 [Candidatus Onthousia excrementipullorum]|uniref:Uncharacterized protein n=1 Tax=Candidatus Onthousia excrementipullorum TaxID=2840884 RepID=A0A9D1J299_9FIRM|nr:hypothetical protein [Candidatus Onthousia excrementipullorum]
MRKDITEETKQRLIPIYEQVEKDFKEFPYIKTTEDFFIWRDIIKNGIEEQVIKLQKPCDDKTKKKLRNKIVEEEIEGNDSLELLYAWTKCTRMITGAKAFVRMVNHEYGIEGNDHIIKATTILHNYLKENGKANTNDLFDILQIRELSLLVKYSSMQRTINTPYEFERAIVKEDESEAWSAPLFVTMLKAYGIEKDDLLVIGRKVIEDSKNYIIDTRNKYKGHKNLRR